MTSSPRTVIRWRTPEERQAVQAAAEREGMAESTWLRRVALTAADREDLLPEPESSVHARALRARGGEEVESGD